MPLSYWLFLTLAMIFSQPAVGTGGPLKQNRRGKPAIEVGAIGLEPTDLTDVNRAL